MKTKLSCAPNFILWFSCACFIFLSCKKVSDLQPVLSSASENVNSATNGKPNIILILADDIGYGIVTANGGESFKTPNIDKMAQIGMRFTNCFASPLCSPSRTTFMTGKYNFRNYFTWGSLGTNEKMTANLMQDAGYATYVAGKWEFDGGDASITAHGFGGYSVWNAFKSDNGSHYKDPRIYENAGYLPDNVIKGKYGDDIFTDRVLSFVKTNKDNNFFVYFPITLCHFPYSPTPDDPQFASWNNQTSVPDTAYWPSMVKYMDKKVGQVMDSLKAWRLLNNTIVIFAGDNGTPNGIFFTQGGVYQEGSKSSTTNLGTKVPLIVSWPAGIGAGGVVNTNLVDFTDFLPTCAEAAGTTIPSSYGTIDGVSFLKQLQGLPTTPRSWVFNHYQPFTDQPKGDQITRWINNATYKLYDSTGRFYNIALDPDEKRPLKKVTLTSEEKTLRKQFQNIMNTMH